MQKHELLAPYRDIGFAPFNQGHERTYVDKPNLIGMFARNGWLPDEAIGHWTLDERWPEAGGAENKRLRKKFLDKYIQQQTDLLAAWEKSSHKLTLFSKNGEDVQETKSVIIANIRSEIMDGNKVRLPKNGRFANSGACRSIVLPASIYANQQYNSTDDVFKVWTYRIEDQTEEGLFLDRQNANTEAGKNKYNNLDRVCHCMTYLDFHPSTTDTDMWPILRLEGRGQVVRPYQMAQLCRRASSLNLYKRMRMDPPIKNGAVVKDVPYVEGGYIPDNIFTQRATLSLNGGTKSAETLDETVKKLFYSDNVKYESGLVATDAQIEQFIEAVLNGEGVVNPTPIKTSELKTITAGCSVKPIQKMLNAITGGNENALIEVTDEIGQLISDNKSLTESIPGLEQEIVQLKKRVQELTDENATLTQRLVAHRTPA